MNLGPDSGYLIQSAPGARWANIPPFAMSLYPVPGYNTAQAVLHWIYGTAGRILRVCEAGNCRSVKVF